MKIGRATQLLFRWEEISAAVPEGSEDRERQRRAIETAVAENWAARSCAGAWPARPKGMREERDKARALMRQRYGSAWASPPPDDGETQ